MGKRSRRRDATPVSASSRAERDAARRARRAREASGRKVERRPGAPGGTIERPDAPWGKFPLTELVIFIALVLGVIGLVMWGQRGQVMVVAAAVLGSLAGFELSLREHFAGYRSHTTLLAGGASIAAMAVVFFTAGSSTLARGGLLLVGALVFVAAFWALQGAFKRRSGGLSFR